MIYAVFRAGVRVLAWVILGRRLRIDGMERMPRRGSVLVIGNHVGTVEPALTGVFIPRRDVYYMAKSELFRNPLLGWLFRRNHAFPVVRDTADRAALRAALAVLADGHVLLVYPEGTRSWDGRIVGEVQAGAGFIARHSGALHRPGGQLGIRATSSRAGNGSRVRPMSNCASASRFTFRPAAATAARSPAEKPPRS